MRRVVRQASSQDFYNVSTLDMGELIGDQDNIRANLDLYIQDFVPDVRSIFEHFDFAASIERLHKAKVLEQDAIADFVGSETNKCYGLIDEAGKAVSILQERRAALIFAAVTGKIDVCNYQAEVI